MEFKVKMDISSCLAMLMIQGLVLSRALPANKGCRCVPDQWSALLNSVERQYDLRGGQTAMSENNMLVNYDYINKIFAIEDPLSGNLAISDYKEGYKYLIREEHCHAIETKESMRKMCLPETADLRGEYVLGDDTPVEIWSFLAPMNMTMHTTVFKETCMPISEEVSMTSPDYASLTTSFYLNVKFGIEKKIRKPANCMFSKIQEMKRGSDEHVMLEEILQHFGHQ